MRWELDPDFALQSRLTFGRSGMLGCGLAAIAACGAALFGSRSEDLAALLLTPGLILLFVALPYSAVQVVALDRDGRFDQRRLAGRPALSLGAAVLTGSSWLLWLTGGVLFFCAAAAGGQVRLIDLAALLSLGLALALLLLVMPPGRAETWLLRTGIVIVALVLVTLAQVQLPGETAFQLIGRSLLVSGAAIAATAFPFAMRRMHRPQSGSMPMPSNILRPMLDLRRTHLPELARTLLAAGTGGAASLVMAVAVVAVILAIPRLPWRFTTDVTFRDAVTILLLYAPILLAAYNCSTSLLRERQFGALDQIRLTAARPWSVLFQFAGGFSLPYLGITLVVAMAVMTLRWPNALVLVLPVPATAVLLIGTALAEGLRSRPVGSYLTPALIALFIPEGVDRIVVLSALWIPWAYARSSVERPDGAVKGVPAVLAAGHLAVITVLLLAHFSLPFLTVAGLLSLAAGLFVPSRQPGRQAGTRAACAVAAAIGAGLAEALVLSARASSFTTIIDSWVHWHLPFAPLGLKLVFILMCALYAAAGALIGWLAHNLFGRSRGRSWLVRAVPLLAAVGLAESFRIPAIREAAQAIGARIGWSPYLVADFLFLAIALMAVIALMTLEWRRYARTRS